jgi:ABC-type phosphate transport system substrate-binding protein
MVKLCASVTRLIGAAIVLKKSKVLVWLWSTVFTLTAYNTVSAQAGRDRVYIVGSSTVYPFSTVVAERFGRRSSRTR